MEADRSKPLAHIQLAVDILRIGRSDRNLYVNSEAPIFPKSRRLNVGVFREPCGSFFEN